MEELTELAKEIFAACKKNGEPVTEEESLEMAKMELGAKKITNYVQSDVNKPKSKGKLKTIKISAEKKAIFQTILHNLDRCEYVERGNIQVLTENKLICVKIGEKSFKIDIIEQRPPKK